MKKKQGSFLVCMTIAIACVLGIFVGGTIHSVNQNVTKTCFNELEDTSSQLAIDLHRTTDMDRTILKAMATIISDRKITDKKELCEILSSYNASESYVTYVEVLRPDNTLLGTDGTVRDVGDSLDFSEEVKKGAYISSITQSTLDPTEKIIRNAVPVIQNEETVYMLYGVVRLSEFAKQYKTNIYDGHAYVYLEDGDTGDFLLDTWHNSFGNINDFKHRKMVEGYDFETAISDMKNGKSGNIGFVSQTTGGILYMHYEPVEINNWNVVVTVEEKYVMGESRSVRVKLYRMAAVIGIVVLFYMAIMLFYMFRQYKNVQKAGMEDQTTGLKNRNAFDLFLHQNQTTVFSSLSCIYLDANGLHELNNKHGHLAGDKMLQTIAAALKEEFGEKTIYRIGGDEFVVLIQTSDIVDMQNRMEHVRKNIEKENYSVAYGIVSSENETGADRIIKEADQKMLEAKKQYYIKHDRRRRS